MHPLVEKFTHRCPYWHSCPPLSHITDTSGHEDPRSWIVNPGGGLAVRRWIRGFHGNWALQWSIKPWDGPATDNLGYCFTHRGLNCLMCASGGYINWGLTGPSYWLLATKSHDLTLQPKDLYTHTMRQLRYRETKSECACVYFLTLVPSGQYCHPDSALVKQAEPDTFTCHTHNFTMYWNVPTCVPSSTLCWRAKRENVAAVFSSATVNACM